MSSLHVHAPLVQPAHDLLRERGWGAIKRCARELGMDQTRFHHVITGRVRPTDAEAFAIAGWLGVAVEDAFVTEVSA